MKANHKVSAFARVAKYTDVQNAKLQYQSLVASTFKYYPLIWMFCGKIVNDSIDRVHKRALRILIDDHESMFEVLLVKNDEINIHTQNLRVLMIVIYKTLNNTNPPFMQGHFIKKTPGLKIYKQIPAAKSITFGIDSIKFRGSLLWNSIPDLIKRASSSCCIQKKHGKLEWRGI